MSDVNPILCESVDNKKRGRGRPRLFDEGQALDSAVKLFWSKGFDGTSVDQLADAMGIGRPSMYGAFGDKEAIFLRCLNRYTETVASQPLCILNEAKTIDAAIRGYLNAIAVGCTSDASCTGCFIVATTADDPKVRAFVTANLADAEGQIARRLEQAIEAGELPAHFPVRKRARLTINTMLALAARARQGTSTAELLIDAADGAELVLAAA